jgi:hypothetical protein
MFDDAAYPQKSVFQHAHIALQGFDAVGHEPGAGCRVPGADVFDGILLIQHLFSELNNQFLVASF